MHKLKHLHWPLIIGLGALALIRPFLNIVGLMDTFGRPLGPLIVTVLISGLWLAVVVLASIRSPIMTLSFAGVVYGIFAILLGAMLPTLLDGNEAFPITNPSSIVSVLLTNAIWGGVVGIIALAVQRLMGRYQ